jgi:hypothetical protein
MSESEEVLVVSVLGATLAVFGQVRRALLAFAGRIPFTRVPTTNSTVANIIKEKWRRKSVKT